jgi:PII-like signaling protein
MDFVKLTRLTIYTAEDVMYQDKPLYKGIIDEARRCKLAGGTVFKADFGFGTEIRGKEYGQIGFFTGMPNLPIIITIVDLKENLKRILPFLEKCGEKHFLAFTEDVNALVTDYIRSHASELKEVFVDGRNNKNLHPEVTHDL